MSKTIVMASVGRTKLRPRGKPFVKGKVLPFQYKPGESGNPGGKPKVHQTMKMNYEHILRSKAPVEVCRLVGVPLRSTWAEVISAAICHRAILGDTLAAKEIREVTEGRIAISADLGDQIDYSAGKSARNF
jgi:hypothetical protein